MEKSRQRVLAVSSGGGHWVQLQRLRPALAGHDVIWTTVKRAYRADIGHDRFHVVNDATRKQPIGLLVMMMRLFWIILRTRPDIVITTGAAPGYFAVRLGRLCGARTIWLDSIANAEEVSLSGSRAGAFSDLWLTQWPHLADDGGPTFVGSVI